MSGGRCAECRYWSPGPISGAPTQTMGECRYEHTEIWAGVPMAVKAGIAVLATEPTFECICFMWKS